MTKISIESIEKMGFHLGRTHFQEGCRGGSVKLGNKTYWIDLNVATAYWIWNICYEKFKFNVCRIWIFKTNYLRINNGSNATTTKNQGRTIEKAALDATINFLFCHSLSFSKSVHIVRSIKSKNCPRTRFYLQHTYPHQRHKSLLDGRKCVELDTYLTVSCVMSRSIFLWVSINVGSTFFTFQCSASHWKFLVIDFFFSILLIRVSR